MKTRGFIIIVAVCVFCERGLRLRLGTGGGVVVIYEGWTGVYMPGWRGDGCESAKTEVSRAEEAPSQAAGERAFWGEVGVLSLCSVHLL